MTCASISSNIITTKEKGPNYNKSYTKWKEWLTGVEPSNEILALENDKLPAKNEPPLWKTFWGFRPSAGHLCTEESVVATQIPSSCNANCKIGCSFVQSNTLSLVAKSVKYNCNPNLLLQMDEPLEINVHWQEKNKERKLKSSEMH